MPHRPPALRSLPLAMLILAAGSASAQSSPYYIGISQTLGYDSNVFRRDDRSFTVPDPTNPPNTIVVQPESSGLMSTTAMVLGFNQTIGRQRVYFDGTLGYASYSNQGHLDTPIYALKGGVDWATAEHWSGVFLLSANQRQGPYESRRFDDNTGVITRVTGAKLTDNTERAEFIARFGAASTSRVWLEGGFVYVHLKRASDFGPFQVGTAQWTGYDDEYTSTALSFGVRTRVGGALTVGAGLRTESRDRLADDRYANNQPPASAAPAYVEKSTRNDIDLFADWNPSGASRLRARLSHGQTNYELPANNADLRGWTAGLSWAWQPTGKSSMTTRLSYDNQDRERGVAGSSDYGGDYYTALEWTGRYQATGKISLDASVLMAWRDFDNTYSSNAVRLGNSGTDKDLSLRLAVAYQALRNVSTGCSLGRFVRNTDGTVFANALPAQSPYDSRKTAYTPSCFVQVVLQ